MGYVEHQWNVLSPLQNVGLFFIGIAPLIGAGAVIYLTTKLMLPGLLDTLAWRIVEIPMGITGDMNDHLSPINKNQIQKLIREELEPTWFDSKSATPDMSWVTPT
ncbi:hypothetical protein H5300_25765, partial [Vibrio sp. SG41-7]|nr:hypothetical protein [Vibrio sp. SG41-7]